ncbi:MAG: hypothetical protein U0325_12165 [Polyangiales bacterium]
MPPSTVAALRTSPETVLADLDRLVDLAGLAQALRADAPTRLIPQRDVAPLPGAHSPPWQLEGACIALRARGFRDLTAVWPTPPPAADDPARRVLLALDVPEADARVTPIKPRARMHALPRAFPGGLTVCARARDANLVHLGTLRPHPRTVVAGAMHGALHALLGDRRHALAPWTARALVDLLAITREVSAGLFAMLDATVVRPARGRAWPAGWILASADPVALDAVGARLLGFDPMRLAHLRLAHDDGLGVADPRDLRLVGDDLSSARHSPRAAVPVLSSSRERAAARVLAYTPLPEALARVRAVVAERGHARTLAARWAETPWGGRYADAARREPS